MAKLGRVFGAQTAAKGGDDSEWISVSDLMSGLMIVFLFISIVLMRMAFQERDKIAEIAVTYSERQDAIFDALSAEFESDLEKWKASISRDTLEVKFNSPEVLFQRGSARLSQEFQSILTDFFPRYVKVLDKYREAIRQVQIEGHTSSRWNAGTSEDDAYFKNMKLSQDRTRSVLAYSQSLKSMENDRDWIRRYVTAIGYSSSRAILDKKGLENPELSRRVTFRVLTNAERQIRKIVQEAATR